MHKHWRTHQNRLTRLMHSTFYTHVTAETLWWWLSEFSVNMHALWLKHLNFPLVPYHTVLHSACSSNRLTGPIIAETFDLEKKCRKQQAHPWLRGEENDHPPPPLLTHFLTSREETSRDTNTSESKGWNQSSHLDPMSFITWWKKTHTDMIWPNSGHVLKNSFLFLPFHPSWYRLLCSLQGRRVIPCHEKQGNPVHLM